MVRFYAESFAPWCEKARWALDHHGIAYRQIEHVPLLDEPRLRWVARRPFGRVSVPLLVTRGARLSDSFAIARWADTAGTAEPLFPATRLQEVEAWNQRSDALMEAGRALLLPRLLDSPEALQEQLPPFLPTSVRPALQALATQGAHYLMRKYGIIPGRDARHEENARRFLGTLRDALARDGCHLIDGCFSYADIAMATALQFFLPVAHHHIRLGPATRATWTHPTLAAEIADLAAWRDRLYATWRRSALP
jgi:glutathione S-transferase